MSPKAYFHLSRCIDYTTLLSVTFLGWYILFFPGDSIFFPPYTEDVIDGQ